MLALLLAAGVLPLRGAEGPASDLSLVLGRPTDRSVTLSVLSRVTLEACVEYGSATRRYTQATETRALPAGAPTGFEIGSLATDTRYYYRFLTRGSGTNDFRTAMEGTFQTQRAPGRAFQFTVQGDSHPEREGKMFDPELYEATLRHVAAVPPDFHMMLGDDFSIERLIGQQALTPSAVDRVYAQQRGFLGVVGRSSALFLVNGNHEQAALCNLDGTDSNAAVLAARARNRFYPLPAPDGFYTGDAEAVAPVGLLRDYYAWTWGDALFVVIDPYWHSPSVVDNEPGAERHGKDKGKKNKDIWRVTLGDAQYRWLTKTLTESRARWKFVFCHHVLGTGRGGVECASLGEWGGKNKNGQDEFREKRPGWELPIHALLVKTGVTIVFQGHDHIFARQELDGVVYQTCPNPADSTYQAFNREAYRSGDVLPNAGYLRVAVSPREVGVDYVRSWLPQDETGGHKHGETAFHYSTHAEGSPP